MWIRRTAHELAQEVRKQKRARLRNSIFIGGFFAVFTSLFRGWSEFGTRRGLIVSPNEIPDRIPFAVICGIIVAIVYLKFYKPRVTMICPKCEQTKFDDGNSVCSCGGTFEKLIEMKFINSSSEKDRA
jgi:hypothetical protein